MVTAIISAIGAFIVLLLAHELGHFFAAKINKVKVEEFGVFLPPRLFSFKKGETIYSFNAIPFGGFNKLAGEEDPKIPGSLASKSIKVRLLVLSAGAIMNLLLPFILLPVSFMIPHAEAGNTVVVSQVVAGSPAATAGLEVNDTLLTINGAAINNIDTLNTEVATDAGTTVTFSVKKANGSIINIDIVPRANPPAGQGRLGVLLGYTTVTKHYPIWEAIPKGVARYWDFILLYKNGIVETIKGTVPFELTGPVGIVSETGKVAQIGFSPLLQFTAIISFVLGVSNLLPIPALDGGRIVFVLLEWVRHGKRISPRTEQIIHGIGFALLLALSVLISFKDIIRIIHGG